MRIGLVGYGKGGRYFHAPLLASLPAATFAGVVTRSASRREELAKDHPGVQPYDNIGQLVGAGVDLIVISTPLEGRSQLIREAIEQGVAVVSDKPFAVDAQEASALIEAAKQRGVPLTVYQNRRWDSDFLTVRKLIEDGILGDIRHFESRIERYSPHSLGNTSGGGVLRDLGSHMVDQALQLFGPALRVYGELTYSPEAPEVDHSFFVALTHANGVVSHLHGSKLQAAEPRRFRVTGSAGTYTVDGLDVQEEALLAGRSPRSEGERWGAEDAGNWGWLQRGAQRERVRSEQGSWPQYYLQLQAALEAGMPPPVTLEQVLLTVRTLDAARESAEKGCVVESGGNAS